MDVVLQLLFEVVPVAVILTGLTLLLVWYAGTKMESKRTDLGK